MHYCGRVAIVNGWLTSVQHAKASQVLEKLSYGYDLVGPSQPEVLYYLKDMLGP